MAFVHNGYLFWHNADLTDAKRRNLYAVRWKNWRLVKYPDDWRLFDLKDDPQETKNLIYEPKHQAMVKQLRQQLFEQLKETGGAQIPLAPKRSHGANLRRKSGSKPADFPERIMRNKNAQD